MKTSEYLTKDIYQVNNYQKNSKYQTVAKSGEKGILMVSKYMCVSVQPL